MALGAVAFGDGHGQLPFCVVVVSDADEPPVVDHGDGVEVGRDLARVVGVAGELVEGVEQAPDARSSRMAPKVVE